MAMSRVEGRQCEVMSCYDGVDPLEEGRARTYDVVCWGDRMC